MMPGVDEVRADFERLDDEPAPRSAAMTARATVVFPTPLCVPAMSKRRDDVLLIGTIPRPTELSAPFLSAPTVPPPDRASW